MLSLRVRTAVLALILVAIAMPASAAAIDTKVGEAALPAVIRADFHRQFVMRGPDLVGTASPCYKSWRFRGFSGWKRRVFPLTEADHANGVTRHEAYLFGARLTRDTSDSGFVDAKTKFYGLSDYPYATDYTVRNGHVKLTDVHTCF